MAHKIEIAKNGTTHMVWAGEKPWHGLGKEIPADLTPEQVLQEAGLDWHVEKRSAFIRLADGTEQMIGRSALVRTKDERVLDIVSNDWNPVQNSEAFEFFNDFISGGDMEMHTAGSLKGGTIVWALAKVKDSFELFGGDKVESYLHFTNFHKYGNSTDVRFTPIRVVCNNTLTLSLNTDVERMVRIDHRQKFNGDNVKTMLGVAAEKMAKYREYTEFLGSKHYTVEAMSEYFAKIFPNEAKDQLSTNAKRAQAIVETQPGANYAEGTFWQLFNTVTFMTDHVMGRQADNRLASAWYGPNRGLKTKALETALKMAEVA